MKETIKETICMKKHSILTKNLFCFKLAVNLNNKFRIPPRKTPRKTKMCPLNIMFLDKFCIELQQGLQKAWFYTKI